MSNLIYFYICFSSVQFSSVTQLCLTLCNPMDRSTPGVPVYHQLPEFTQTHVHWFSDAIQASQSSIIPLSSCLQSFPASGSFQMSQLFALGGQSTGASVLASVLQWIFSPPVICFRIVGLTFSSTTVRKPQFFGT